VGFGAAASAVDTPPLGTTGTYSILVDPGATNTGNVTLTLSQEVTGTITVGGSTLAVNITRAGQRARITFEATAGQRLNLGLTGSTFPVASTAAILNPSGTTIAGPVSIATNGAAVDTAQLAATGTHAILIDPNAVSTGSVTLTLSEEQAGTITPGTPVTVAISRAGQRARLTFSGTSGTRMSVAGGSGTITTTLVSIIKPDGGTLGNAVFSASAGFLEPLTLTATGTHALLVDPDLAYTGDKPVTLHTVPADVTGTLTINGSPATVTIAAPGQNAQHTFSATSGQAITVRLTSNTVGCLTVSLHRPDGTWVGVMSPCGATGNLAHTPTATGTYTIKADPTGANTGTFDVSVTNP
jgi:hypothetical protein